MVFKQPQYFFKEAINRDLVEKHNADMIRTAMPVKAEKILRRFGKKPRTQAILCVLRTRAGA